MESGKSNGKGLDGRVNYESPLVFTRKQRLVLATVPRLIAGGLKSVCVTCRHSCFGSEQFAHVIENEIPFILAFWHESLGLAAYYYRGETKWHTLTSYSFDGELAARTVRAFGMKAVRGSSSRGGSHALRDMQKVLKQYGAIGFTLDGPRGPRRTAKPGVSILAARTGAVVLPHAFTVTRAWRLRSWDRFPIPKPFGHIVSAYGDLIPPPPDCSSEALEHHRVEVENALNVLHGNIEREYLGLDGRMPG